MGQDRDNVVNGCPICDHGCHSNRFKTIKHIHVSPLQYVTVSHYSATNEKYNNANFEQIITNIVSLWPRVFRQCQLLHMTAIMTCVLGLHLDEPCILNKLYYYASSGVVVGIVL